MTKESSSNKSLEVKIAYNPKLKIIAYAPKKDDARKKIYDYLLKQENLNGKDTVKIMYKTRDVLFSNIQGFFMERFGGYKKI